MVKQFEKEFEQLISTIMTKVAMTKEQLLDFNTKQEGHKDFDELFNTRKDMGYLLK